MQGLQRVRHGKYNAVRVGKYASKREAEAMSSLWILEKAGCIKHLHEQVPVVLVPGKGKVRPVIWIADAVYEEDGRTVYADVKGYRTPVYKLKKRLAYLLLGIEIMEI